MLCTNKQVTLPSSVRRLRLLPFQFSSLVLIPLLLFSPACVDLAEPLLTFSHCHFQNRCFSGIHQKCSYRGLWCERSSAGEKSNWKEENKNIWDRCWSVPISGMLLKFKKNTPVLRKHTFISLFVCIVRLVTLLLMSCFVSVMDVFKVLAVNSSCKVHPLKSLCSVRQSLYQIPQNAAEVLQSYNASLFETVKSRL